MKLKKKHIKKMGSTQRHTIDSNFRGVFNLVCGNATRELDGSLTIYQQKTWNSDCTNPTVDYDGWVYAKLWFVTKKDLDEFTKVTEKQGFVTHGLHREDDKPAALFYYPNGFVKTAMWFRFGAMDRKDGLPNVIEYSPEGQVVKTEVRNKYPGDRSQLYHQLKQDFGEKVDEMDNRGVHADMKFYCMVEGRKQHYLNARRA